MAYTDTSNMPLHMPTPGTKEPASIALLNENCVVLSNHDHTTGKGLAMGRMRSGLAANRPAAGSAGNVYFSTDTGVFNVDTGTAWVQFLTSGGQATVTGWTLVDPTIRDTINWGPEGSSTIDGSITRSAAGVWDFAGTGQKAWASFRAAGTVGAGRVGQPTGGPANDGLWLASNADFNGTSWNRDAIASPAAHISLGAVPDSTTDLLFNLLSARAGANPITWISRLTVNNSGNVGVGIAPADWHQARRAIQLQDGGAIFSGPGYNGLEMRINSYQNASNLPFSISANAAGSLALVNNSLNYSNAPSVAAGAQQTFTSRLFIAANGTATLTPDDTRPGLVIGGWAAVGPWASGAQAIQVGQVSTLFDVQGYSQWGNNTYNDTGADRAIIAAQAGSKLYQQSGSLVWLNCPAVAAGATQAMVQRFKVDGNGTVAISPVAGQVGLSLNWPGIGMTLQPGVGNNAKVYSAYQLELHGGAGAVQPPSDNSQALGWGDKRWTTVFAVAGSINTSHVSMKRDFAPLDPAACTQAVLDTDWLSFTYNPPAPPERVEGTDDETWTSQQSAYQQGLTETASARRSKGYVLGSEEYTTAELFGQSDRKSGQATADLAVVACALQDALRRLAALEAKNGNAAAA